MKKLFFASLFSTVLTGNVWADDASCALVRSADMGWTDIALTTNTAAVVLDAMGYKMDNKLLGLNVAYVSLKNENIDVFLGNWRPAQDIEFKEYYDQNWVEVIGTNLTGAKYTLAVPSYVADAGVKTFDDLAKFPDKFSKKIYGIEPGSNLPLLDMIKANSHGLKDWEVVESSEQAMLTQVSKSVEQKEWIVFLGWQPHPMNIDMQMTYLAGGDAEFGPNFGGSIVNTISRPGYTKSCPNMAKFFKNLAFDVDYENTAMRMITVDAMKPEDAATAMIKKHPEKLDSWLAGVTTLDGKPALDAVKAALLK